jgi:transposase, IS5 family
MIEHRPVLITRDDFLQGGQQRLLQQRRLQTQQVSRRTTRLDRQLRPDPVRDGIDVAGYESSQVRGVLAHPWNRFCNTPAKKALLVPTASVSDHWRVCAAVALLRSPEAGLGTGPAAASPARPCTTTKCPRTSGPALPSPPASTLRPAMCRSAPVRTPLPVAPGPGFSTCEQTPERTAFVRFRAELVRRGLDRPLFEIITRQLDDRGVIVGTGTLVDATLIPSASIRHDGEARWAGHRRRKPVHGYKAHVATDQEAGLIRGIEVTTANVHDAAELDAVLPDAPGDTYGDTAYSGSKPEAAIRARGGKPCVVHTDTWGGPNALTRLQEHNAEVRRVRSRIEKVFGTCKRFYGLRRMRWLGLAKAGLQVRLTAMAYNLRRSWRLLAVAMA